jgi:RecA-family ATPase
MLEHALAYLRHGRPVFPCGQDKAPLTAHGFKDASADPETVAAWWGRWPDALIGLPTGQITGTVVLDVDRREGIDGDDALAALAARLGPLPETVEALTPSGGRHLYFKHPGRPVPCSASRIGLGLDVRGDGGYVIAPPSVNGAGSWEWEASNPPALAELPAPWAALLAEPHKADDPRAKAGANDPIGEGRRNAHLAALAGALRRRGASLEALRAALHAENEARCRPPLDGREVDRIAESVGRYAPHEEPPDDGGADPEPEPPSPLGYEALFVERPAPPPVLLPGVLPCDAFALVGPGGVAKTSFDLWLKVHLILGRAALGRTPTRAGPCVLVSAEDSREVVLYRVREICDALGLAEAERQAVAAGLYVEDLTGSVARLVEADERGNLMFTGLGDWIARRYAPIRPVAVTFDPAVYFGPGERFVNDAEAAIMQAGRRIGRKLGGAAVGFIHHTGKAAARDGTVDQYAGRGGSALADNSRGVLVMHWHETDANEWPRPLEVTDEDMRDGRVMRLHVAKFSAGRRDLAPIWIVRGADNPWRFDAYPSPDEETQRAETARRSAERAEADVWAVARFLHAEAGRKPPVRHTGRTLEDHLGPLRLSRARLRAAVHRGMQTSVLTEIEAVGDERRPGRPGVLAVHPAARGRLDREGP